jgi:hypothetical protein
MITPSAQLDHAAMLYPPNRWSTYRVRLDEMMDTITAIITVRMHMNGLDSIGDVSCPLGRFHEVFERSIVGAEIIVSRFDDPCHWDLRWGEFVDRSLYTTTFLFI